LQTAPKQRLNSSRESLLTRAGFAVEDCNGMEDLNLEYEELIASIKHYVSRSSTCDLRKKSQSKRLENSACNAEFAGH
jgi:hypothetical protein